jgi:mannonate dehydratase
MVAAGYLTAGEAEVLSAIRRYNALLFDFVLKRRIQVRGKRLPPRVFETRRVFERRATQAPMAHGPDRRRPRKP